MLHHLSSPFRSPNLQRNTTLAPGSADPSGKPQIREPNHMVGMMVGKKHSRNIAKRNPKLVQSLHSAATRVEDEFFLADSDLRPGPKAVETRRRRAASEESYSKSIVRWFCHRLLLKNWAIGRGL